MKLKWQKEIHGQLRYMENGDNKGSYRRLKRGKWVAILEWRKRRVRSVIATNERDIKSIVRQWVEIPF